MAVDGAEEPIRLAYSDIDRARTVFVWGGQDTPGNPAGRKPAPKKPGQKNAAQKQTQKRKQVVTP